MNRYTWRTGVLEAAMIAIGVIFMIPIYVLVNIAVRGPGDTSSAVSPTSRPTFANFIDAWNMSSLGKALITSTVITVVSVGLIMLLGAMAAYGLVRVGERWARGVFYLFLLGLLIPFQLIMVPMYQNFAQLDMVGTPITLIPINVGVRLPFTVFLYATFLRELPSEYEEAAALDGAGPLRSFGQVVLPLMRPVTGTVIVLNGLFVWNDFLTPLLYLSGTSLGTVPLAIYSFVSENATQWSVVFSALIISCIPVLIMFFFLQRSLIRGFASGVKG